MPSQGQVLDQTQTVIGWGTTSSGGSPSDTLLEVDVPFVSDEGTKFLTEEIFIHTLNGKMSESVNLMSSLECNQDYGAGSIFDSMICAGVVGKDSCQVFQQ